MDIGTQRLASFLVVLSSTALLLSASAAAAPAAPAAEESTVRELQDCSVDGLEVVDGVDDDGDGYYARAALEIRLDTECPGAYDSGGVVGDAHVEPVLRVNVDGQTVGGLADGDYARVENLVDDEAIDSDVRTRLEMGTVLEQQDLDRGTVTVTVELWDDDSSLPGTFTTLDADKVDEASVALQYEPPADDENTPPTARFTVSPGTIQTRTEATFDASESTDADTEIRRFEWDLDGDGDVDERGERITHSYESSGSRTVSLTVTDMGGATETTETTVVVEVGDADDDGLNDDRELAVGTDPESPDTDGDGLDDGAEVADLETDPTTADTDGDGLDDGAEIRKYGTDPTEADTDGDGLDDGAEVNEYGTDPTSADTDSDGIEDGPEVNEYDTDPTSPDTDGDGDPDDVDPAPTDPSETRTPTTTQTTTMIDSDGDGVPDSEDYAPHDADVREKSDLRETETTTTGTEYVPGFSPLLAVVAVVLVLSLILLVERA